VRGGRACSTAQAGGLRGRRRPDRPAEPPRYVSRVMLKESCGSKASGTSDSMVSWFAMALSFNRNGIAAWRFRAARVSCVLNWGTPLGSRRRCIMWGAFSSRANLQAGSGLDQWEESGEVATRPQRAQRHGNVAESRTHRVMFVGRAVSIPTQLLSCTRTDSFTAAC